MMAVLTINLQNSWNFNIQFLQATWVNSSILSHLSHLNEDWSPALTFSISLFVLPLKAAMSYHLASDVTWEVDFVLYFVISLVPSQLLV